MLWKYIVHRNVVNISHKSSFSVKIPLLPVVMGLISSLFNSYLRCVNCSNSSRFWAIFHTTWLSHCWIAKGTFQPCLIISWYMKSRYIRTDWWKKPPCPRNATPIFFPWIPIVFQDFPVKTIKNIHLPWIFPRFSHDLRYRSPGSPVPRLTWLALGCLSWAWARGSWKAPSVARRRFFGWAVLSLDVLFIYIYIPRNVSFISHIFTDHFHISHIMSTLD